MNKLTLLFVIPFVVGCKQNPYVPETRVVTIDKPIPYCPAPPVINECDNYVNKLTPADNNDPGKVAQAYKADMMCYRSTNKQLRDTLTRYSDTSKMLNDVDKMYEDLGMQYNNLLNEPRQ